MKGLLASVAAMLIAGAACAQFALDARYTDADGDLIADIPADAAQQVDPDALIFAYSPAEDPAVYAAVWAGFIAHMEQATGKKVQFFPVQSNAAQIEAMSRPGFTGGPNSRRIGRDGEQETTYEPLPGGVPGAGGRDGGRPP